MQINDRGLAFGNGFILARNTEGASTGLERARILSLLAIAYRHPICPNILPHLDAATKHWRQGEKTLAHIRLNFSGLSRLEDPTTSDRLRLADWLLNQGMSPIALLTALDLGPTPGDFQKHQYHPDQPRVPAGNGRESGRWVAFWHAITSWLDEPVPEYDPDTGTQVGTRTRARAIATNPITVGIAGATALAVGETVIVGGAAAVVGEAVLEGAATAVLVETRTGIKANAVRGLASQARILREMGYVRNTSAVVTEEGRAIPDALDDAISIEVKDVLKVSHTKQIRIQTKAAARDGQQSLLITGEKTHVSKNALKAFKEVLRSRPRSAVK